MSRVLLVVVILALAGCGGGYSPPRELDNACAIARERPNYVRAMERAERRWGVPVHVQMAMIHQESKFVGNARTPHQYILGIIPMGRQSSAYGYAQAIDGTWNDYIRATGKRGARRDRINDATDFMGWYMTRSRDMLGIPLHDARNQYLAYHEGQAGFKRQSYMAKPWLIKVADRVSNRADLYREQLARCRR
ncbi:lytic transglycosylase [Rhodovulum sp.]|uniref:transglycosylase SLT domain-containing protein n=1 Tax=Rhodovulum sp. TaxID=34009 RepID=UPI0017FC3E87|nr:lytic transglycosylase [Rhodovulum sp.]HDR29145.1 lytic transglycosylase [Rhodovulum sp.]